MMQLQLKRLLIAGLRLAVQRFRRAFELTCGSGHEFAGDCRYVRDEIGFQAARRFIQPGQAAVNFGKLRLYDGALRGKGVLSLLHLLALQAVFLDQLLTQSAPQLLTLVLQPSLFAGNVLLQLFRVDAKLLLHNLSSLLGPSLRALGYALEFLGGMLPKLALSLADFLFDGIMRRPQQPF